MTLFNELKNDHAVIHQILSQILMLNDVELLQRDVLIKNLEIEILSHTRAEEIILYNPLRLTDFSKRFALHGYKEHIEIETLLRLLQLKNAVHINWKETAHRLNECLQLHIQEEELEIFDLAEDCFNADEIETMGQNFFLLKNQIKRQGDLEISTQEMAKIFSHPLDARLV